MTRRWKKIDLGQDQPALFPDSFQSGYYQPDHFAPRLKAPALYVVSEVYCVNESCAVRSAEVLTKLIGPSFPQQPAEDEWFCNHCKSPAKLLFTLSPSAYRKRFGEYRDIMRIIADDEERERELRANGLEGAEGVAFDHG